MSNALEEVTWVKYMIGGKPAKITTSIFSLIGLNTRSKNQVDISGMICYDIIASRPIEQEQERCANKLCLHVNCNSYSYTIHADRFQSLFA